MRVAILGTRGIPECYGGFETLAEKLATGLVESGLTDVFVYCRNSYFKEKPDMYKGVRLIYLPAPRIKALESLFHSFVSSIHVLFQKIDVIFFVDPANAPFFIMLRLFGKKVVVHTDGLGWKRAKWGYLARRYYKFTELLSKWASIALVTDNPAMREYYLREYGAESVYIPYGAESGKGNDESVYREIGIEKGGYLLVVARFEPENNVDIIIKEYTESRIKIPMIIVGSSPYGPDYEKRLKGFANDSVRFIGRVDDQARLNALYAGAYLYIHGHSVGGTNPSLLRAMNASAAPLVLDEAFNVSVIGNSGFCFTREKGSLAGMLKYLIGVKDEVKKIAIAAKQRADKEFCWGNVVAAYADVFKNVSRSR